MAPEPAEQWPRILAPGPAGIARWSGHGCDVGSVVAIRARRSGRFLVVRKSPRAAFEGSDQFAFPGGLLRSPGAELDTWVRRTLVDRARAESGCEPVVLRHARRSARASPVLACYTARGARRSTLILPCTATVAEEFTVRSADPSVYGPEWRLPASLWHEITPTNGLILAAIAWRGLSQVERRAARRVLADAHATATTDALAHGLAPPRAPWADE